MAAEASHQHPRAHARREPAHPFRRPAWRRAVVRQPRPSAPIRIPVATGRRGRCCSGGFGRGRRRPPGDMPRRRPGRLLCRLPDDRPRLRRARQRSDDLGGRRFRRRLRGEQLLIAVFTLLAQSRPLHGTEVGTQGKAAALLPLGDRLPRWQIKRAGRRALVKTKDGQALLDLLLVGFPELQRLLRFDRTDLGLRIPAPVADPASLSDRATPGVSRLAIRFFAIGAKKPFGYASR